MWLQYKIRRASFILPTLTEYPCHVACSDTKRETSRQYRCGPLRDVHKETGPSDWPWHRGTYLPPEGTKDCHVVCLTIASRSVGDAQLPSPQIKSQDIFDAWVSKLRHHRLYRQNEIVRSPRDATMRTFPPPAAVESPQPTSSVVREAKVSPTTCVLLLTCLLFIIIKINNNGLQFPMKSTDVKS